jgi:predicted dehydrogenase
VTPASQQILIIGLGDVAATHLTVLEQIPDAQVVAGVDIVPKPGLTFRGQPVPVYQTPRDAAARHGIDIAVIATSTPAHAAVCEQVAGCLPAARILIEKPAAAELADARHVLGDIGSRQPVDVAYHMAFAPEVTWARHAASTLGHPVSVQASFTDPYSTSYTTAAARLGTSWTDSGINALSILTQFTQPYQRTSLRRIGEETHSAFEAHITCQASGTHELDALILTSWHVTDPAKTTRIRYSSGAELVMDHTAVAAYLIADGRIRDLFSADASIPRRERHYQALYQHWLTNGHPIATPQTHLLLHDLLLQPVDNTSR